MELWNLDILSVKGKMANVRLIKDPKYKFKEFI